MSCDLHFNTRTHRYTQTCEHGTRKYCTVGSFGVCVFLILLLINHYTLRRKRRKGDGERQKRIRGIDSELVNFAISSCLLMSTTQECLNCPIHCSIIWYKNINKNNFKTTFSGLESVLWTSSHVFTYSSIALN